MRPLHKALASDSAFVAFPSELGWIVALSSADELIALSFGHLSEAAALVTLENPLAQRVDELTCCPDLVDRLAGYAAGERVELRDIPIDLEGMTPFQRRVTELCRDIPFGETMSYAELAARAGSPGAARAVGNVMAANPYPLVVPCHRVVAAGGRLGNYSGPQGVRMKRRLLELERQAQQLSRVACFG